MMDIEIKSTINGDGVRTNNPTLYKLVQDNPTRDMRVRWSTIRRMCKSVNPNFFLPDEMVKVSTC